LLEQLGMALAEHKELTSASANLTGASMKSCSGSKEDSIKKQIIKFGNQQSKESGSNTRRQK